MPLPTLSERAAIDAAQVGDDGFAVGMRRALGGAVGCRLVVLTRIDRGVDAPGDLEGVPCGLLLFGLRRAGLDGEPSGGTADRAVATMATAPRTRRGTARPTSRGDGVSSLLHVSAAVLLVGADAPRSAAGTGGVCGAAGSLELSEDGLLVSEEVAYQSVAVSLLRRQAALRLRSEDAPGEVVGERRDVALVRRRQLDETREVGGDGVEGGNVGQPKLTQGVLNHRDPRRLVRLARLGGVDGLDDLVDV